MAWAFDAASNNGARNDTPSNPQTFNHTTGAGSNRLLVVGVRNYNAAGTKTVTGVTYNGTSMTQLATYSPSTGGSSDVNLAYYYLASPSTGTNSISITWTGTTSQFNGVASSYTGLDGTPTIHDSDKVTARAAATTSISMTGLTVGDVIVGIAGADSGGFSASAGTTERSDPGQLWIGDADVTSTSDTIDISHVNDWTGMIAAAFSTTAGGGGGGGGVSTYMFNTLLGVG